MRREAWADQQVSKGSSEPESSPLHSQLQEDGQGKVLVLERDVAFGTGTSMYVTDCKEDMRITIQNITQYKELELDW